MELKVRPNLKLQLATYNANNNKKLMQKDIATILSVTNQQVSNWFNGVSMPPLLTAIKLSVILECKVDDLWIKEKDE